MQRNWSSLVSALLLAATADAQEALFLPALIDEALRQNPGIHRASQMLEAANTRPAHEGALPDPMLQLGLERNPIFVRQIEVLTEDHLHLLPDLGLEHPAENMTMLSVSLSQELPDPGKRRLRRQLAEEGAAAQAARLEAERNAVAAQVKTAYFDLAEASQGLEVVARTRHLLRDFEATALSRYRVGKASQQEVLKAQVEAAGLLVRGTVFSQRAEAARARLNALLNRPPGDPLGPPDSLPTPGPLPAIELLGERARQHNPLLHLQRRQLEAAQLQVSLAQKEYRPDLTLSAGWKTDGGLDDLFLLMVEAPLPLQRQRRQAAVRGARAEQDAARSELLAAEQQLLAQVRDLYTQASAAGQLVDLYRRALVPQTRLALESALTGYRVGQVDLLMVLDNSRTLLEEELMVQEQLATHHRALAQLAEAVGASLEP